jgi:hypothetical protein
VALAKRPYVLNEGTFSAIVGEFHHRLGRAAHAALQEICPGAPDVYVLDVELAATIVLGVLIEKLAHQVHMDLSAIMELRQAFEWN